MSSFLNTEIKMYVTIRDQTGEVSRQRPYFKHWNKFVIVCLPKTVFPLPPPCNTLERGSFFTRLVLLATSATGLGAMAHCLVAYGTSLGGFGAMATWRGAVGTADGSGFLPALVVRNGAAWRINVSEWLLKSSEFNYIFISRTNKTNTLNAKYKTKNIWAK